MKVIRFTALQQVMQFPLTEILAPPKCFEGNTSKRTHSVLSTVYGTHLILLPRYNSCRVGLSTQPRNNVFLTVFLSNDMDSYCTRLNPVAIVSKTLTCHSTSVFCSSYLTCSTIRAVIVTPLTVLCLL